MFYYTWICTITYVDFTCSLATTLTNALLIVFLKFPSHFLMMHSRAMLMVKKSMVSSMSKTVTAIHAQGDKEDSYTVSDQ